MNILMVLTSHDRLGNTGKPTGFWLEEFAAPYYVFKDAGARVTLAAPLGGQPPLDPKSNEADAQTDATRRFESDPAAQAALAFTHTLRGMHAGDFDALFFPGGHGPLWDLVADPLSIDLIESMLAAGKPVAAVCHAPAVLRHVQTAGGESVIKGRAVTGFANSEERAAGLADVVPFLVEDMLTAQGGRYSKAGDWQAHVVSDCELITGQNPASSAPAALALLERLRATRAADGMQADAQDPLMPAASDPALQGEGNYAAARRHHDSLERFIDSGQVEEAARNAAPTTAHEAQELVDAERAGLAHSKGEDRSASHRPPRAA